MSNGHSEDEPNRPPRVVAYVDNAADWIEQLSREDSQAVRSHLYG